MRQPTPVTRSSQIGFDLHWISRNKATVQELTGPISNKQYYQPRSCLAHLRLNPGQAPRCSALALHFQTLTAQASLCPVPLLINPVHSTQIPFQ